MYYINCLKNKLKKKCIEITAPIRRSKLVCDDFTIISNNCWGGDVYRYFGLPYLSPTVGLYFWADDYIRFLSNLPYYLSCPLEFISLNQSKYKEELVRKGQESKVLARLYDVELVCLHYQTQKEAKIKWERRVARVNYNHLIVKFSRQNLCQDEHIAWFMTLPYEKKLFFDNKPSEYRCSVYIPDYKDMKYLNDDISTYRKYMNILKFVNKGDIVQKDKMIR